MLLNFELCHELSNDIIRGSKLGIFKNKSFVYFLVIQNSWHTTHLVQLRYKDFSKNILCSVSHSRFIFIVNYIYELNKNIEK